MKIRIAVVEDDREISSILKDLLEISGYECVQAFDGDEASKLLSQESFDMVLMDLMLPYKNGERLIAELRENGETPVIVISAKSMMETKLEVLRRSGAFSAKPVLEAGELSLNTEENRLTVGGKPVQLTAKELMLIKLFLEHPKKVYTKAELYETVWNEQYFYEDNTINVHVSNLRSKLKKASGKDHIETVWGIGYRLKGYEQ